MNTNGGTRPPTHYYYPRSMAVVPASRNPDQRPAHTRKVQHNCRQGVTGPTVNQTFPNGMQHRSVCLVSDSTPSQICQLETRVQCILHRCHDTRLGSVQRISFSTFLPDPSSPKESIAQQGRPCPNCTSVAGSTLVACSPQSTDQSPSDNPELQTPTQGSGISTENPSNVPQVPPSHFSYKGLYSGHYQNTALSHSCLHTKTYQSAWGRWSSWCSARKIDPISASLKHILHFLADCLSNGSAYRSVNIAFQQSLHVIPRLPSGTTPFCSSTLERNVEYPTS